MYIVRSEIIRMVSKSSECALHSVQSPLYYIHLETSIWEENLPHNGLLCLSFSSNFISYFKQALKLDWLFCFSVSFSLAGENM